MGRVASQFLRPPVDHLDLPQPQHAHHVLQESHLLARRLQQRQPHPWADDLERQPWKPRSRAHVNHPRPGRQFRPGQRLEARERIEKVTYQHPLPIGDGGQVKALVPGHQFPVTSLKGGEVAIGERDTQFTRTCD